MKATSNRVFGAAGDGSARNGHIVRSIEALSRSSTLSPNATMGPMLGPNLDAAELDAYFPDGEKARVLDSMNWRFMVKGR